MLPSGYLIEVARTNSRKIGITSSFEQFQVGGMGEMVRKP